MRQTKFDTSAASANSNEPEIDRKMTTPSSSLKRARRLRPRSQPRGIARLFRRAFHANASWVVAAPKSTSREPPTRFLSPLTRRALDRPDRRCQRRRQNRATTGIAPRRDARAAVFDAIPFSGRVDRGGTGGRVETARCRVAPTAGDPRADRARRANRTRPRAENRSTRATDSGWAFISVSNTVPLMMDPRVFLFF